jgi:threonine/homoserine/homoserine lactone efflux protein
MILSLSALFLFAAVYFAAVATPGPGIAALVARVLRYGLRVVAPFIAGYVAGDMIWLILAGTGLSMLANAFAGLFVAIKYLGAAYLLYVAWKMATASVVSGESASASSRGWRAFFSSLSLTLGNPKVMIFFLSIMPLVVDVRTLIPPDVVELAAVSLLVISATLAAYALAANRARGFLRSTRAMRIAHRAAGGLMASVAVAVATR